MTRTILLAAGLLCAAIPLFGAPAAQAADIKVLAAGAYRPVVDAMAPAFEARTGNKVVVTTDTAGGIAARIGRGEPFDIAILTQAAAHDPQANAQIILVTPLAAAGMGVAVKDGAPKPDIATEAAFKQTLLGARSIAMVDPASGGTSGIYLAEVIAKLGIADQLKPKLVLTPGGLPGERVVNGQAELALGQISELVAVKGVTLVGPLPPPLQQRTVYVAGMNPKAAEAPLVLLAALASPDTAALLKDKGLDPP